MKSQRFITGLLLILSTSSANAQFDLLASAGNIVVQVAESAILGVCFVTNLSKNDVKDSFFAAVFNTNNPNVTQCTLGCAITGLYEGKSVVEQFTGTDLTEIVSNVIGKDLYGVVDDCFNYTKDAKCTFFDSYESCIVTEVVTMVQKDVKGTLTSIVSQIKTIVNSILDSAVDSVPAIQSLVQPIQQFLDVFFNLATTTIQSFSFGSSSSTSTNTDWNIFSIIDALFPKATTSATTVATSTSNSTVANTTVATTTQKSNNDPIGSLINSILKNIPIIG